MATLLGTLTLAALCGAVVWKDVRERRIPNGLVLGTVVAGLAWRFPLGGVEAVGYGALAAVLAFVFGFLFFLLGGLGAGDVKFMAGAGAFVGMEGLLVGFLVMAATGGIMALAATLRRGAAGRTFRNLGLIAITFGRDSFRGWKGEGPTATLMSGESDPVRNPYGIAIAAGALAGWCFPLLGWSL
jgi:prepilin peptidase CpaA